LTRKRKGKVDQTDYRHSHTNIPGFCSAFKSNAYIKFAETLALDRFLPAADPEKREKSMAITRQIAALRTTLNELQYTKVSIHFREGFAAR
jgi:hypothetical protein